MRRFFFILIDSMSNSNQDNMFTIIIKGQRDPRDAEMVKLSIVFYRTGFARIVKVLNITGLYADWDIKARQFKPNSADNITKNKLLRKERIKYLRIAERWVYSGKAWTPMELSHYYDNHKTLFNRNATVAQVFDMLIEENKNHRRVRNGFMFSSHSSAGHLSGAKRTLENFTLLQYRRKFSRYRFRDIDINFLLDYTLYLEQRYAATVKKTGVRAKLLSLYSVFVRAQKREVYNVDITVFNVVRSKLKQPRLFSKAITHETMIKIEQFDRSNLLKREELYLDMFMFSYYAGGMSGIDVCYLEHCRIRNGTIEYERIKTDTRARVILPEKAQRIIDKYRGESYFDFVFPVFKKKDQTMVSRHKRVQYIGEGVNTLLRKVCADLEITQKITWSTARSSFISKMLDEGYHPLIVAEQTGNSPQVIYKNYYSITNPDEVRRRMNQMFK